MCRCPRHRVRMTRKGNPAWTQEEGKTGFSVPLSLPVPTSLGLRVGAEGLVLAGGTWMCQLRAERALRGCRGWG